MLSFRVMSPLPQFLLWFFFLMIRRPPRSTLDRSSAASDVYKRQVITGIENLIRREATVGPSDGDVRDFPPPALCHGAVSYTHLRAHETVLDLVCRLLLEKKKQLSTEDAVQNIAV